MKIIHGLKQIPRFNKPVVALGVFDGMHLGHGNILKAAVAKARQIKGTSVILTFWPHPQKEESLYSLEHRLRLIEDIGIDVCIVINFNENFARISAINFVKDILIKKIAANYVYVGKNFRFGKNAAGDFRILQRLSGIYNFGLKLFDVIKINNKPISSTYIRNLIKKGKLDTARKLLTRPVSILGTVIKGASIAGQLGFSTANINPHHEVIPPEGIYAVRVIFARKNYKGVCYIGTKPTIKAQYAIRNTQYAKNIEVHIFNFNKKIYGEYLEIHFIKKIRNEKKFASTLILANRVKKDILVTQQLFSRH